MLKHCSYQSKCLKFCPSVFTQADTAQPSTPLVDCLVDDMLQLIIPCSNQAPLQISNFEYGCAGDTLLHDFPDFIVHCIQVCTIWWQQIVAWARPEVRQCHEHSVLACCHAGSLYKVQYEHIKRDVVGGVHVCFKFSVVCLCQALAQSDDA